MAPRDAPYVPIANGTRTGCWDYLWWNEKKAGSPISCRDAAQGAEISLEQFFLWNPSLDQNVVVEGTPTYDFPCTISPYVSYCMQLESPTPTPKKPFVPPSPRAQGEIANCVRWFRAYFPCSTQLRHSRMSMQLMYRYNPSLKEDCSGYTLGTYYCHETLEDYHGYGLRREDVSKSKPYQNVPTADGTNSGTAQPTGII
ncbi:uncharacterized protein B0J16DRAFT_368149 [Fusarium flagelliforme]|uniref:uncharacterized protein n=1 Tax=Fusarium flagelliforme TaxID=2675880 RepID=UPI001E8D5B2A|nr:uncharacterized protein B0J16DRAFT_368149 [Fusarium flagelliforme]KAH7191830.1 hypothetical protein B0J16DRAFT_368149 [Fusarium flagelliforme]